MVNKCTILKSDVHNGEDYAPVRDIREISVPLSQFCCKLENALEKKVFKKNKEEPQSFLSWIYPNNDYLSSPAQYIIIPKYMNSLPWLLPD